MQHSLRNSSVNQLPVHVWIPQHTGVFNPALQQHVGGCAQQRCNELALPLALCAQTLAHLPSRKVISSAREILARCLPEQVFHCLSPFADKLRMQGWTVLISDCGKSGEHRKALAVFQTVPQTNVWHHSALIAALGACGQCEQALQHLEQLKQLALQDSTLQPNHVTYSAAIAACARVQRLDRLMQLFTEMQERGLEPDSVTYYIVQSSAVRMGEWQLLGSMLQDMHGKGMPARPMVYAAYIRQLCREHQWNHALGIFLIMQDLGVPARTSMITDLLGTFNHCGKHYMAALLLKEAEAAGLVNSASMYAGTRRALEEAGHMQAAGELRNFMQNAGRWQPTTTFMDQSPDAGGGAAAGAAVAPGCLQDSSSGGQPQAEARADTMSSSSNRDSVSSSSNSVQLSPQSSLEAVASDVVSKCLEQCDMVCYLPAAACSCDLDAGTDDYSVSTASSTKVSSDDAASVVSALLTGSDSCNNTCSKSPSSGGDANSTAAGQPEVTAPQLESSIVGAAGTASANSAARQRSNSSRLGGSRTAHVYCSYQQATSPLQYTKFHNQQHQPPPPPKRQQRQQHHGLAYVPSSYQHQQHQQQQQLQQLHHLPGSAQRSITYGVPVGMCGSRQHSGQCRPNQ